MFQNAIKKVGIIYFGVGMMRKIKKTCVVSSESSITNPISISTEMFLKHSIISKFKTIDIIKKNVISRIKCKGKFTKKLIGKI